MKAIRQTALQLGRFVGISLVFLVFCISVAFWVWTKNVLHESANLAPLAQVAEVATSSEALMFPLGVDPQRKHIIENPVVEVYAERYLTQREQYPLLDRLLASIVQFDWYQNLASAVSRILVIYPGERREEITENFAKILRWTPEQKKLFLTYITVSEPYLEEGKFYPGRYVVPVGASPELVADLVTAQFEAEVLQRYSPTVASVVPLEEALVIASLLEREAYDFTDMRYISGIIWNRLFINMPLQLDATLQYVRGSSLSERIWWPKVVPDDKYLTSPYNTYQNPGLPPTPIANPSAAAIIAALNPRNTECMFYFHDQHGTFYCTETYEEHVTKLKEIYGRGK